MSMTITYNTLFEIRILHHYFLNRGDACFDTMTAEMQADIMLKYSCRDFFRIRPTEECSRLLASHRAIFRQTDTGVLIGLKTEPEPFNPGKVKPFVPFRDEQTLTFLAEVTDMNFFNFTALPLTGNEGMVYVFQNTNAFVPRKFPSLGGTPPKQVPGNIYLPGDMVADSLINPKILYTARVKTSQDITTGSDWLKEKKSDGFPVSYVNGNERFQLVRGVFNYKVKSADIVPMATMTNEAAQSFMLNGMTLPGEFNVLQFDLRHFPEGLYSIRFTEESSAYEDLVTFFLLHRPASPFAIIRITIKSNDPEYHVMDYNGCLLSPVFDLRFRNRATHWRYVGKKFNPSSVTELPLPLTRLGVIDNVRVPDKDGIMVEDLPNPSSLMIKTEALTIPSESRYFSEIHIN